MLNQKRYTFYTNAKKAGGIQNITICKLYLKSVYIHATIYLYWNKKIESETHISTEFFCLRKNVIETNNSNAAQTQRLNVTVVLANATNDMKPAKQEDGSPELLDNGNDAPQGGGGLVGIITSLSGVSMIDRR